MQSKWISSLRAAKQNGLAIAALLALLGCGAEALAQSAKASGEPITIGIIEDRSGGAAFYSQEGIKAIKAYVESMNAGQFLFAASVVGTRPGIMGRPIKLIFQEDENNPNLTVVKTRRLVKDGAQVIFFMSGSSSAIQGRVVCSEEKVFCIVPFNVAGKIVEPPNNEYVFSIVPMSGPTAGVFVEAWKKLGVKRVAYYSDSSATAKIVLDAYKGGFEKAGFTTVADEVVQIGARDATTELVRIRDAKPDVIFDLCQNAAEDALLHRSAVKSGVSIPRWATNSVTAQPKIWDLSGDSINGLFVVDNLGPDNPNTNQVRELYAKKYGTSAPFTFVQGAVWDALILTKKAVETAGSTAGAQVREATEKITGLPSAYGQKGYTLSFSPEKHNGSGPAGNVVVRFAKGRPSILWDVYQPK